VYDLLRGLSAPVRGHNGLEVDFGFQAVISLGPSQKRRKLIAESANDRLVTTAIIGVFGQGGPTGSAWGGGTLYPGPPLRASRTSGGERGTLGIRDPAGLTADRNEENFVLHRQADLKRGRIA
jgi:hypothetical protein